jgi:hypothetical protein
MNEDLRLTQPIITSKCMSLLEESLPESISQPFQPTKTRKDLF